MKGNECKKSKKGFILIGIGVLMLMGLLHLGFLIPFMIAGFLIYKGWNLIKGNARESIHHSWTMDTMPEVSFAGTKNHDHLDEWEKQVRKNYEQEGAK